MILTLKVTDNVNVCVSYCRVIRYRLSCSAVRYNEYAMLNVIVYLVLNVLVYLVSNVILYFVSNIIVYLVLDVI